MRLRCGFVVLVATLPLLATSCSPTSAAHAKVQPDLATLDRALGAWNGFPVNALPRPVLLLAGSIVDPKGGFPDDASKEAYGNGQITAPSSWPSSPGSSMGYPITTASTAFRTLTMTSGLSGPPVASLEVTEVILGSGEFQTDRGYRTLPAWLFSLSGIQNPAEVLAISPSHIYDPPGTSRGYSPAMASADLGADGVTMVINFSGAPAGTGPCTADYTLSVKESKQAVAVAEIEHAHGNGAEACALVAYARHLTAKLATALGGRVAVDARTKGAMLVTPVGSTANQPR